MELRPDTALRSAIKSLTDVVLPAVDPKNGPALEQLQITIGMLTLVAERIPLEYEYDCDELKRLLEFARQLGAVVTDTPESFRDCVKTADAVLSRAQTTPTELLDAIRALRKNTSQVVGDAYARKDGGTRQRISSLVLAHAEQQLTRERAWLLPQGWEAAPEKLPAIEDLLDR